MINIIGLGDSYTEGNGTPGDSTWLHLLETKLNRNGDLPNKVQCINGGIMGTDPFYEYVMLNKLLLKYKPRIVLLCINQTDITDVMKAGGWERFSKQGGIQDRPQPWWYFLFKSSVIARCAIRAIYHNNWLLMPDEQYETERKAALRKLENCVTVDYLKLAKTHHFKLIVVLHPLRSELVNSDFELQTLANDLEKNKDIETINLYSAFKEKRDICGSEYKGIYWPLDGHNNPAGYNLWAEIVYVKLLQQNLHNL